MKFIDRIASRLGYAKKRGYAAAKQSRLTSDWTMTSASANTEIRRDVKTLRARSRQLERDNDYARRYFKVLENNVLGAGGIKLQAKAKDVDGTYDTQANAKVEAAWRDWGKMGNCTVTGSQSWQDAQRLILRSVARDGSCLVRKVPNYDNSHRFALQILEADMLNHDANKRLQNGNTIRMGVEIDRWEKPIAYHLLDSHDGDEFNRPTKTTRIPADQIIHAYMPERAHQSVGAPWLCSAMGRLNMLAGYEEAELVAARVASCKMGFYIKSEQGEGYQGEQDETGNLLNQAEPAAFEELPFGTDFKTFDPSHPNANYGEYVKACLRGVASGLGVSYTSLANDLEGVNYSSIRAGLLEEREEWRQIQNWFVSHLVQPIYDAWLPYALLSGTLELPAAKVEKFGSVEWRPRRWQWVDPLKDTQASVIQIANGLKSRRAIIAEGGGDIVDTFQELEEDAKLADSAGLRVDAGNSPKPIEGDD